MATDRLLGPSPDAVLIKTARVFLATDRLLGPSPGAVLIKTARVFLATDRLPGPSPGAVLIKTAGVFLATDRATPWSFTWGNSDQSSQQRHRRVHIEGFIRGRNAGVVSQMSPTWEHPLEDGLNRKNVPRETTSPLVPAPEGS